MRWQGWAFALLAVALVACEERTADPDRATPGTHGDRLLYECDPGFPFDPFGFEPGNAEEGPTPLARALRRLLAEGEGAILPQSGWTMVGRNGNQVGFVARDERGNFYDALVEKEGGRWEFAGLGECKPGPELAVKNASIVEWVLDPNTPVPEPGDRVVHALVNELACHGFEDPLDRMNEAKVLHHEDRTYIVLTAEPPEGLQPCPGTPWVEFDIELDEPLTNANLFDAGIYPPRRADREPR